jgi:hypothetical protein
MLKLPIELVFPELLGSAYPMKNIRGHPRSSKVKSTINPIAIPRAQLKLNAPFLLLIISPLFMKYPPLSTLSFGFV